VKFVRVDADVASALKSEGENTENEALTALFREVSGNDKLTVRFEALKDAEIPAILNVSEESRRMEEMMRMYQMNGMGGDFSYPVETSLVVNLDAPLIKKLTDLVTEDAEKSEAIANYIYKLALISQRKLTAEEMEKFLDDGFGILERL
jgi:molecular chaperone HtpG